MNSARHWRIACSLLRMWICWRRDWITLALDRVSVSPFRFLFVFSLGTDLVLSVFSFDAVTLPLPTMLSSQVYWSPPLPAVISRIYHLGLLGLFPFLLGYYFSGYFSIFFSGLFPFLLRHVSNTCPPPLSSSSSSSLSKHVAPYVF
jgi:hypothetical protein